MTASRSTIVALFLSSLLLFGAGCSTTGTSALAIRDDREHYVGCHVGGGTRGGRMRYRHEGTWARDFAGWDFLHVSGLRWARSTRNPQGGMGSY